MYDILKKLEKLIIEFDEIFSKRKRDKNIVDFTDIEHFALNILVKDVETTIYENGEKRQNIIKTEVAKKYTEKFEETASSTGQNKRSKRALTVVYPSMLLGEDIIGLKHPPSSQRRSGLIYISLQPVVKPLLIVASLENG